MIYWYMARNTILTELAYRHNILFRIIRNSVILLPQLYLWKALYAGHGDVAGVSARQMTTFVIISTLVGIFTSAYGANEIEWRMKSGDIGTDIMKPISPLTAMLFKNLGSNLMRLTFDGLPAVIIGIAAAGGIVTAESLNAFLCFIIAVIGAMMINFLLQMLVGTLSFWFVSVWLMEWVLHFFYLLFSGGVVPLWFLPDWMRRIAEFLPFQAVRFTPLAIYLGKYMPQDIISAFLVQAIWIAILWSLLAFLWNRGLKRITIMGG